MTSKPEIQFGSTQRTRIGKLAAALAWSAASAAIAVGVAIPAHAQTTTASLNGRVTSADGAATAGANVSARDVSINRVSNTVTDANGNYTLSGLRPGTYEITYSANGETTTRNVVIGIGQSATLDVALGAAEATAEVPAEADAIVVTGNRLVETKTSEIATNVSAEQIRNLPQSDRNFLAFSALAPGVRYNDSETDKSFTSGASTASQVNVFIDGVSLKNKLREGGVAGQQNSRGNPFGQLAVQEFRVLTQNYKAEYEQAGAAIITAVTKSGTNEFHGEIFGQYTDRSLSEINPVTKRQGLPKPPFERKQYGVALGGPIIQDKLFFFLTYEGNDQDRALNVVAGSDVAGRADFEANSDRSLSEFEGAFVSPFRGDFYFGKLTFTPDSRQTFDISYSKRQESDIQGFGGNTAFEAAENKRNTVDTYLAKWTFDGDDFLNEFSTSFLDYTFNPTSLNPDLPQFEYQGVIIFGGKDSTRLENQKSYSIRNDFTYTGLDNHSIKAGARVEIADITFNNNSFIQPRYTFVRDTRGTPVTTDDLDFSFPAEARLGLGNARISDSNNLYGFYIQDDWSVTDRLELNIGLRWDYETNGFNNDYVTPAAAAAAIRSLPATRYFNPENYISNGRNRDPYAKAFAPRFGFSYDLSGDQRTVIFGGVGRYFDRNTFNNTQDELSRSINPVGVFRFSRDGLPRNGQPTVVWDPRYLTREGLLELRATAETGLPELFAVPNNARPPVNDQASLGIRQKFGDWRASVTASYQRGKGGYTNLFATRQNDGEGNCCDGALLTQLRTFGYSNLLIGVNELDTRYKALYVTLDKDYTKSSGWGLNIAYTLSKAEQNGNDLFSLDGVTPDDYGFRARPGDERHRVVLSGIVDLPLGFRFSTLTTLGSGQAYQVFDATNGFGVDGEVTSGYPEKNCLGSIFAFCEVNVTLAKTFDIFGDDRGVELAVDVLNAFRAG
jgi:hypothetical protein